MDNALDTVARRMHASMTALLSDDRAASLVEYAILLGLIALAAVGAVTMLGNNVDAELSNFVDEFERAKG